jgi:Sugar (and other) transporter
VYISEISPAKHRGELVTWSEIGINVGIVLGFINGLVLSGLDDGLEWRALFVMGAILPVLMIYLAVKVMPESPRWYVLKFRYDEARSVLHSIYPPGYNVDLVMDDIKESLERERLAETTLGWWTIFHPTPAFRRMLTVGLSIAAAQQLVGIDAIQYYLLDVLESATDSQLTQQMLLILLGCIKLACIVIAGKLFDYRGRRPLVFLSLIGKPAIGVVTMLSRSLMTYQCLPLLLCLLAGMTVALLMLSITFYSAGEGNANIIFTVLGLGLYLAFFSSGIGPAAWLIPSEVFATCIRAKAMSLATVLNRVFATVMSSTFLTMKDVLTWEGYFFLLAAICVSFLAFFYSLLPETKGHSLEDMSLYFAEITQDSSILEAERTIRVGQEFDTIAAPGTEQTAMPQRSGTLT